MKYLISCLEPSANLHFKGVFEHLKKLDPACEICGIFDEKFGSPIYKSSEFSAMGFIEILPLILKAKRAMAQMTRLATECDRVLLIDSPAFNLPLARAIKESGARAEISYYILPQIWAWKPHRAEKLKKFCDNLLSIWPFEAKFFGADCEGDKDAVPKEDPAHPSEQRDKSAKYSFVGHPLLDEIKFQKTSYEKQGKIAFMPGSRRAEISRLMPIFRTLAPKFENSERVLIIPPHLMDQRDEIYGPLDGFSIANDTPTTLKDCDFAFICSGTATLEAALIGTPFVLCYKARAFDVWLARKLVKLKHVGLANIIFDFLGEQPLHEELLQSEVSAQNLLAAYERCDAAKFKLASEKLRDYLKFGSSENVAKILTQPAS